MTVRVQAEDFDVGAAFAELTAGKTAVGGVCLFVGLVRDMNGGAAGAAGAEDAAPGGSDARDGGETDVVSALTLEHYPGMTERQLAAIEAEARARWPLDEVLIVHRYGRLTPGDRIVLTGATSAHRDAAFESCRFLMDWLKTKAPFWKCEETPQGPRWVGAKRSDDRAAARWEEDAAARWEEDAAGRREGAAAGRDGAA